MLFVLLYLESTVIHNRYQYDNISDKARNKDKNLISDQDGSFGRFGLDVKFVALVGVLHMFL